MKIALLGCGVVGGGILEIAQKRSDMSGEEVLVRRGQPEVGGEAVPHRYGKQEPRCALL